MNKYLLIILFLLLFLLIACDGQLPALPDMPGPATTTALPSPTFAPTATAVQQPAEGIGRAFYRAWEGMDFEGMYSLLSPQSQSLVDKQSFIELYEETMSTATVQEVHAQPLNALQENNRAQMNVRVIWNTAVVGTISRDHLVELAFSEGRWGVVWDEALVLPELEGGQRLYLDYRIPARANIYDREGTALAFQGTSVTLGVVPGEIEDEPGLLQALSPLLEIEPNEIRERYSSSPLHWRVPLGSVSSERLQNYGDALTPYLETGLYIEQRPARVYPDNGVAPHIVGFVSAIPAEEIDSYRQEGYRGDEVVGRAGVEAWGETYLRGTRGGVLTIIGSNGEYITTVQETEPRQARSIYLTLDAEFQLAVEQALAEAVETSPGVAGSVVVLDVNSGEVLAMASYPTYNPAIFDLTRTDMQAELAAVLNDPGIPLLNRAAQGAYPTGSVFKVITLSAGLNSGLYTMDSTYTSVGSWNRLGPEFIKTDWNSGGHGNVTMAEAIIVSCNTCFYDMGYNVNAVDPYLLPNTARRYGLGSLTGIEGINESPGTIPDPEWKMNTYGEGWVPGDAVNMAIGQGFVQVTPLQAATVFAALANGGILYQPKIIDRLGTGGGAPEEVWPIQENGEVPISDAHLEALREALWGVANGSRGTATHRFTGLPVPVAGKTGTAETPPNTAHSWFAGYAPAAPYTLADGTVLVSPEIAVVAMLENAGEGSTYAAPLFRRVVELYYGIEPVPFHWIGQ